MRSNSGTLYCNYFYSLKQKMQNNKLQARASRIQVKGWSSARKKKKKSHTSSSSTSIASMSAATRDCLAWCRRARSSVTISSWSVACSNFKMNDSSGSDVIFSSIFFFSEAVCAWANNVQYKTGSQRKQRALVMFYSDNNKSDKVSNVRCNNHLYLFTLTCKKQDSVCCTHLKLMSKSLCWRC